MNSNEKKYNIIESPEQYIYKLIEVYQKTSSFAALNHLFSDTSQLVDKNIDLYDFPSCNLYIALLYL